MFLQRALRSGLALVIMGGLASFSLAVVVSTARSQSAQETAIGPDAVDALAQMGKPFLQSSSRFSRGRSVPTRGRTANCYISLTRQRPFIAVPIGC